MEKVKRLHIFLDGLGWAGELSTPLSNLKIVQKVSDLPVFSPDIFITTFEVISKTEELIYLRHILDDIISKIGKERK